MAAIDENLRLLLNWDPPLSLRDISPARGESGWGTTDAKCDPCKKLKNFHPIFPRSRITCDNDFMFPSWSRHETLCRGGSQRFQCLSVTCGQAQEGSEDTAGGNLPQLFPSQVRACGLGQPCKRPGKEPKNYIKEGDAFRVVLLSPHQSGAAMLAG